MTIEAAQGTRLAPAPESPFWRDADGERLSYQEVVAGLRSDAAREAAERHAEAVGAVVRAAALARLGGDGPAARRFALAASRLCEEIAGFWPRDSWKPIRLGREHPASELFGGWVPCRCAGPLASASAFLSVLVVRSANTPKFLGDMPARGETDWVQS